jgi:DNA-binding NarL/FixJ family response regulator
MTFAAVLFGFIAFLIAVDVVSDYRAGTTVSHLLIEGFVMVFALAGVIALGRQVVMTTRQAQQLRVDLEAARREAQRFREEAADALRGLGEAIDRQFGRWNLTPAERDVGLLLLKGLSHREIAQARSTSETTIRQQALVIYRKAGLRNRSELSAFFLEDLLLPVDQR